MLLCRNKDWSLLIKNVFTSQLLKSLSHICKKELLRDSHILELNIKCTYLKKIGIIYDHLQYIITYITTVYSLYCCTFFYQFLTVLRDDIENVFSMEVKLGKLEFHRRWGNMWRKFITDLQWMFFQEKIQTDGFGMLQNRLASVKASIPDHPKLSSQSPTNRPTSLRHLFIVPFGEGQEQHKCE